jgi:hypothetical protein
MYYYVIIYGIYNINHYLNRYRCILMVQVPTSGGFYYGLEVAKSPCYPQKKYAMPRMYGACRYPISSIKTVGKK